MRFTNKNDESYDVLSRFTILENNRFVTYCRIKFFDGHEHVIEEELMKSGDFKHPLKDMKEPIEPDVLEENIEEVEVEEPATKSIIAHHLHGEKVVLEGEDELEAFCQEKKLDFSAVMAVLDGKAKTHRKWGFSFE